MNTLLWIDDERQMPEGFTHWAKTSQEAISILSQPREGALVIIAFDHDLGYDSTDFTYDDVRPVIRWMHENDVYPEMAIVHSHNPIGAKWIMNELKDHTRVLLQPYNPKDWT